MTYYELLGVAAQASPAEIRAAWRARLLASHPDHHVGESAASIANAERETRLINDAWAVLGDPARRQEYDHELRRAAASSRSTTSFGTSSARTGATTGPRPRPNGPRARPAGGRNPSNDVIAKCPVCATSVRFPTRATRLRCPSCSTTISIDDCPRCHRRVMTDARWKWVKCLNCGRAFMPQWWRHRTQLVFAVLVWFLFDLFALAAEGPSKGSVVVVISLFALMPVARRIRSSTAGRRRPPPQPR